MKTKLDEIIEHIKHISFKDLNGQVMCVDLKPTLFIIEQLRPYVELGEYCFKNWVIDRHKQHIIIEGRDDFEVLIQQIKEQENEHRID
jgi:uncharacterized metal-binding protein